MLAQGRGRIINTASMASMLYVWVLRTLPWYAVG